MSLTNTELISLAKRMDIPLEAVVFKSQLKDMKLKYNKSYIINLEDEFDYDEEGKVLGKNSGTHYTCFQVNKYKNGKIEGVYLDPYGVAPPTDVEEFVGFKIPYSKKQIQGSLNNACGWFCCGFLHYINSYEGRSKDLHTDAMNFTEHFEDLTESNHHLKNEWVLKHFFRSSDPTKRKPIEVEGLGNISDANERTKIVL
jgi:hypothetical protein